MPSVYQSILVQSYFMTWPSSGLPCIKDRLLSCATKILDRIAQNPPVEESISSHRLNRTWDHFPMPSSVVHPLSFQRYATYCGNLLLCLSLLETAVRPICGHVWYSLGLRNKNQHRLPSSLISEMHQASSSDMATESSSPYLVKFAHPTY